MHGKVEGQVVQVPGRKGRGSSDFLLVSHGGFELWAASGGFEKSVSERYELEHSMPLERRLFVVRQDQESVMRRMADQRRFPLPQQAVDVLTAGGETWTVYSDAEGELTRRAAVQEALETLSADEAVMADRAGCSLWSYGLSLRTQQDELDAGHMRQQALVP